MKTDISYEWKYGTTMTPQNCMCSLKYSKRKRKTDLGGYYQAGSCWNFQQALDVFCLEQQCVVHSICL